MSFEDGCGCLKNIPKNKTDKFDCKLTGSDSWTIKDWAQECQRRSKTLKPKPREFNFEFVLYMYMFS